MIDNENLEFLRAQIPKLQEAANAVLFPQFQYSNLVPVKNTEALGVQRYQGSKFAFSFTEDEIETAMAAGVDLPTDGATDIRHIMERTINEITIEGDLYHNWSGLINAFGPKITTAASVDGETSWVEKSSDQVIEEVNGLILGSAKWELADTLLLPLSTFSRLASEPFVNGKSLLRNIEEVTVYTGISGLPLTIRALPALETAGHARSRRAIAYWRDSSTLRLHLPVSCAFGEPEASHSGRYVVPGTFRTSGLKIVRPERIRYLDGI